MMFLLMVRVDDPLVPRAMFGVLNTAAFLPLRRHVSHRRLPRLASRHRGRRSFHLLSSTDSKPSSSKTAALWRFSSTCSFFLSSASARCSSPRRSSSALSDDVITNLQKISSERIASIWPHRRWLYTESVMRRLLASSLFALLVLAGCHSGQKPPSQPTSSQNVPIGEFEQKVYHLRGKVVSTDAATGEVTVNHEAIPGFMEAMTMPYKLKDASILGELHPGDVITADLLVLGESRWGCAAGPHRCGGASQARLPARGLLSCAVAGRCCAGLQAAQPGWPADSSRPVSRQVAGDHVYLHALPLARVLPEGDAQLCCLWISS